MLAGIVSLDGSTPISADRKVELRRYLSRYGEEVVHEVDEGQGFFLRANTGSLTDYPGVLQSDSGEVSMLAGEPLLSGSGVASDHRRLVEDLQKGAEEAFKSARGVFCGFRYRASPMPTLELFGDKVGCRPLYFWRDSKTIAFASALRVLEGLSFVPKKRDAVGLAEKVCFGVPLARRTRYEGIGVLREAEVLRFSGEECEATSYWRWDQIPSRKAGGREACAEAYRLFKEAIRIRLGQNTAAVSFLSGGMDSRAIVAVLMELGIPVRAVNFAHSDHQDRVFARLFAEKAGCELCEVQLGGEIPFASWASMNRQLREAIGAGFVAASEPTTAWSGDGGSVGLGSVYLDDRAVSLMRNGDVSGAVHHFRSINRMHFPLKVMRRDYQGDLAVSLDEGVEAELSRFSCEDPAQALFLFLIVNDQRRHLAVNFESLDLHRIESQVPFYDSKLLEFVFSLPLDYRLNHRFYTEWFQEFPAPVRSVPYQTYPGHVPCPVSAPEGLVYQWQGEPIGLAGKLEQRVSSGTRGLKLLFSGRDLGPISRSKFFLANFLQVLALRDYSYVVKAAEDFSFRLEDRT